MATSTTQVKAGESIIGGLFVGGLFLAITAVIFGWISQNTNLFDDSAIMNVVRQIAFGAMFIFILAILANFKVLDIMEDHAYTILKMAFIFIMVSVVGFFLVIGLLLISTSVGLGGFMVGIGLLIAGLLYAFRSRIANSLKRSAEWLAIAANIVLAEPGMIFLSLFQSFVMAITIITEILTIFAWNNYADSATIDPQLQGYIQYIIAFVYLLISFFVLYFFDGAIIFMAYQRIKNRDPTIGQGLNASTSKIASIFGFAVLTTVVKSVLAALRNFGRNTSRESNSIQGAIFGYFLQSIAYIGEWIYHVISFFTLPIIIIRKKNTMAAMKESKLLFGRHLWNIVLADMGFSFGSLVIYSMTGVFLAIGGFAYGYSIATIYALGSSVGVGVVVAIMSLIFGLAITKFFLRPLYTTFVTTIYVYASEGPEGLKIVSKKLKNQIGTSLQNPKALPRGMR